MNDDPGDDFIEAGGRGAVGTAGLRDVRSRRLVVVSHCLLDQNTRYPGGAVCPGAVVPALQEYLDSGVGLLQMPCPEQRTWGGVRRPPLLWVLRHRRLAWGLRWLMPVLRRYLRWRYGRLARTVTRDVADAARSGQRVVGVVGVAGSPSCGVHTTLDLRAALRRMSQDEHPLTAPWLSNDVVGAAERPGAGIYTQALRERFAADGVDVPFIEYRLPDSDR